MISKIRFCHNWGTIGREISVDMSQSIETCVGPIKISSTCKPERAVRYSWTSMFYWSRAIASKSNSWRLLWRKTAKSKTNHQLQSYFFQSQMPVVNSKMAESCRCCRADHASDTSENAKVSGLWSVKIIKLCSKKYRKFRTGKCIDKSSWSIALHLVSAELNFLLKNARSFYVAAICCSSTAPQSCKSGRVFRVGFGPNFDKNFWLISGRIHHLPINCNETVVLYLFYSVYRLNSFAELWT